MSNPFIAAVRSVIQAVVALGVVAVGNFLLVYLNVTIDIEALTELASLGLFGFLVFAFNALSTRYPIINTILSLGFGAGAASYGDSDV